MATERVAVVGAGILGLAVARRLGQVVPDSTVTVLEKESAPAAHQTGHNSGVAHAGLYYEPGSLKAILCRRGIVMLKAFCEEHSIPYEECGKLVVARNGIELARLDEIERRARANGVPGLRRLGHSELARVEPNVRGAGGLYSPSTAILDFGAVARAIAAEVAGAGGALRLGFAVSSIRRQRGEIRIGARSGEELSFDRLVLCAGLQSDRLAELAGDDRGPVIIPFRGEYRRIVPGRTDLVRGLIYPVPDPAYPFLGVHFTRRIDGSVDIGPNAVLAFAREGYSKRDVSAADLWDVITSVGFRRLARKHWRTGAREMLGSLSARAFIAQARTFVPDLSASDVTSAPAGVRAQAIDEDGTLVDDFRITIADRIAMLRNAPSPAATSSLAIAEYVTEQVMKAP